MRTLAEFDELLGTEDFRKERVYLVRGENGDWEFTDGRLVEADIVDDVNRAAGLLGVTDDIDVVLTISGNSVTGVSFSDGNFTAIGATDETRCFVEQEWRDLF